MAKYTIETLDRLSDKINQLPKVAKAAMSNTLNKTGTEVIRQSINEITNENNLTSSYLKQKIKLVARAKRSNLRTIIRAEDRRTLLSRYPYTKVKGGVNVSVKRGGSKFIKGGKIVNLRSGNGKGIALRNPLYHRYLKTNTPPKTTKRNKKISKALNKSINRKFGYTVLHAPSVNQMFKSVSEEIKPKVNRFMINEFFKQFRRLSNK